MDDLQRAKIITAVCLLVTSAIASFLPWMMAKRLRKTEYAFSLLNCLSGGIVLGSGLSHMLPDSAAGFRAHLGDDSYPYAELIAGGTLIILYAIEKIALGGQHSHSDVNFDEEAPMMNISPNGKKKSHGEGGHSNKEHGGQHVHASEQNLHHRHSHSHDDKDSDTDRPADPVTEEPNTINACDVNKNMEAIEDIVEDSHHRADVVIQAIVFLVALSMHSLFEGLGLGAETTDNGLYGVLAAVVSHKLLEAFALGLAIYRARFALWLNIVILIGYALATPIGTIAGMFAATDPENAEFIAAILVSIAAGSFFYIALVEILPNELNKPTSRKKLYPKIALMAFGWGFMAFIAMFA